MRAWWVPVIALVAAALLYQAEPAHARIGLDAAKVVKRAKRVAATGKTAPATTSPGPAAFAEPPDLIQGLAADPVAEAVDPPPVDPPPPPVDPPPPVEPPPPIEPPPTPPPPSMPACTQTLSPGESLAAAIAAADGGETICLDGGTWSASLSGVSKPSPVTVRPADEATASLRYSLIAHSSGLAFLGLKFTGGVELIGASSRIEFRGNELTGTFGIRANGEAASANTKVTDVVIAGNYIHDIDYSGAQGTANGYGITAVNGVERFTIAGNLIESVAADYLQSASPVGFDVLDNTFLGPSLVGSHPQEHQDLWQIFGGGEDIVFSNNVARNTGTHESLLFQEGAFTNVTVTNNLFDHDSRGYTCQIYQSSGLVFRNNTVVGSHWGCLFRDLSSSSPGSGYQIDHNIFVGTEEGSDISTEGRAGGWGTYDYNVSEDGSADGAGSVRNWSPSWQDAESYTPVGLPLEAGYRP